MSCRSEMQDEAKEKTMDIDGVLRIARNFDGDTKRKHELRIAIEALVACAAVCARLRIATGERIGQSDPPTEAWNKALRDAEKFITERFNAGIQARP
mgnify:CR=1 FL=1